jgi:hypothetical protein
VGRHISISFSRRNPLFTRASRSSVFILDFFHSLFGLRHGGDVGGDDPWADPSASLQDLFFSAPTFEPLDGDDFILQVHGVFTRIRSVATLVVCSSGARWLALYDTTATATVEGNSNRSIHADATAGMENPKGFDVYL